VPRASSVIVHVLDSPGSRKDIHRDVLKLLKSIHFDASSHPFAACTDRRRHDERQNKRHASKRKEEDPNKSDDFDATLTLFWEKTLLLPPMTTRGFCEAFFFRVPKQYERVVTI
jgi:hypothetical protein